MRGNPLFILLGVSVMLWLGAQNWRRRRVKRAARDLPTRLQRLLGPEPEFAPPSEAPEGLAPYVALHARAARVERALRGLALLWLAYVLYLAMGAVPK